MYDELVKALRICEVGEHCDLCPKWDDKQNGGMNVCQTAICKEAADAIEELQRNVEDWKATAATEREAYWHWFDNYQRDVPKWIPVTERLPEEAGYYITAFSKGEVGQNLYMTFVDGRGKWYQNSEDTGEVTHWMPLPTPPKEEKIS